MNRFSAFFLDRTGSVAEFALVLPVAMVLFFGIIDGGRYIWQVNQAEKATQMGARFAVVTDPVANGLSTYSFAVNGGIPQGTIVPKTSFLRITCSTPSASATDPNTVTCVCPSGAPCAFGTGANSAAFASTLTRMQRILPGIQAGNLVIDYSWSGLGFSGDPNGPDVAPLTTISLRGMTYQPSTLLAFGMSVPLPQASYSLTMEDGQGTVSN